MGKRLYTIGYENCEIDEFVEALSRSKIRWVADVRKNPVSRKPGFSKSRLAAKLGEAGIEYLHLPELGVPTQWRKDAKAELISRDRMFQDYRRKVLPKAHNQIERLKSLVSKSTDRSRVAVLCYEADACDCHRADVAKKVAKSEDIRDLDLLKLTSRVRSERSS